MPPVNLRDPASGKTFAVEEADVPRLIRDGWTVEGAAARTARLTDERREDEYGGVSGAIAAGGAGLLRGATLGLSDAAFSALGEDDTFRNLRDVNPGISTATEIVGAVAPAVLSGGGSLAGSAARLTPAGQVAQLGGRIAAAGEGAGAMRAIATAAKAGAVEGALQGVGQTISEVALSEDPLTVEQIAASLGTNVLLGAGIGGIAGGGLKGVEKALGKAKSALDKVRAAPDAPAVADDLASLDAKGLRVARQAELETIEQGRVAARSALADDLGKFRQSIKDEKIWLATKDAKKWTDVPDAIKKEMSEVGRVSLEADRTMDRMLRNPKALASRPQRALDALQQQEAALERIANRADDMRAALGSEADSARLAAVNKVPSALERNRALQARIQELVAPPASPRLSAIDDARDMLTSGRRDKGLIEQVAGGATFSAVTGAIAALPIPGSALAAPFIGARAASFVGERLFGSLAKAGAETAKRMSKAVDTLLDVTKRVQPAAPVLSSKVLAAASFAPSKSKPDKAGKTTRLADSYKERSEEIRSQVAIGPDGAPVLRRDARARVAERLAPIGATDPVLADRLETMQARRVEFLARKLPKRSDASALRVGPDLWQPSDFEMRGWARYVAAVEDPAGIAERLASGAITHEDAEVMREVYPEMLADLTRQVLERLPTLRATLPYQRRVALSLLTGVAVDPAMDPRILRVLQGSFANEPGTEGGTQAPTPKAQFGSVRAAPGTLSQRREQGATV